MVSLGFSVFIFAILIQAILSWVNPGGYNPALAILYSLTEPVLRPLRGLIPPISGIDLSPLFAILILEVARRLVLGLLTGLLLA
ncbi:YggT family protein [Thiohalobacter thiocyanaticus]|uniref:YggT family protein n=1 Tax=Thiohalobacter thiocyanaticus TaxID=585455 RepID=A0A426QK95_9GAMM|nr:YggT family protein [Thiohalobacter thiocyanaticus]